MSVQHAQQRELHERSLELAAVALDFELTRAETAELEAHLAGCPTCARRAAAMRGDAVDLGRRLTLQPSARVDAAIAAEIAGRRADTGPQRLVLVAAAAMLALALLGAAAVGAYLLRNVTTPPITDVTPVTPPAIASPRPDASPVAIGETWGTIDFAPGSGGSIEAVALSGADVIGVGRGECIPAGGPPTQCYAGAWTGTLGEPWVRVPDQPDLEIGAAVGTSAPAARILDVATGPGTTLAIGYADDGRARVWRTTDGQAWQFAELDPGSPGATARVGAVLASPDGFLVVGWVVADTQESARAAVWSTPDGVAWTRSPDSAEMDVGPCFIAGDDLSCGGMLGVVRTPSGFVAVGSTHAGLSGTEPSRPMAWTSPDGVTWTQSRAGLDFVGLLSDVAAGGPGLVAVGTTCPPGCFEPTAGAVAATSVDGATWTFTKVAGATGPQRVASIGQRVFAIGFLNGDVEPFGDLQVWQTDDGVAWQRMTGIPSTTDRYGGVDIAASNGRLVIVGWQSLTGVDGARNFAYVNPPVTPAVDASTPPDASPGLVGESWRSIALPESDVSGGWIGRMTAVTVTDAGFVAVGLPVCAPENDPTTCYASAWTAAPGQSWIRAADQPGLLLGVNFPADGPDPGMVDVAAGPGGLVAIGIDYGTVTGPAIWRSPDGRTWDRVPDGLAATPPAAPGHRVAAITAGPSGYVIVGYVVGGAAPDITARAAAWTSPDGITWTRATDAADMDVGQCIDTGEEPSCGGMLAVTATTAGFVAVGETCAGTGESCRPAAWKSADGLTWVRIDDGLDFNGRLDAAAVGASGIVGAGRSCVGQQCSGVDAFSTDGDTWTFKTRAGTPSDGSELASSGGVVMGAAWNLSDGAYNIWRLGDGLTREPVVPLSVPAGFQNLGSADIATSGGRVVIVGWANLEVPPESSLPSNLNVSYQSP